MSIYTQRTKSISRSLKRVSLMGSSVIAAGVWAAASSVSAQSCTSLTTGAKVFAGETASFCNLKVTGALEVGPMSNISAEYLVLGDSSQPTVPAELLVTGAGALLTVEKSILFDAVTSRQITVENGGVLNIDLVALSLESDANHSAFVRVTGAGSALNMTAGAIHFGSMGRSDMLIADGGHVTMAQHASMGAGQGGASDMTVTGTGSRWDALGLDIAGYGHGILRIQDGGVVNLENYLFIANRDSGSGDLLIEGENSAIIAKGLSVGSLGNATVTVRNGGLIQATYDIRLGSHGWGYETGQQTGTLNIGGAYGEAAEEAGRVAVATLGFGQGGTLNLNHTGDFTLSSNIYSTPLETAVINQIAGDTTFTGSGVGYSGTTNVLGGSLTIEASLKGTINVLGGTFTGMGLVNDLSIRTGGTYLAKLGQNLRANGDVTFATGSFFDVEIDPATGQVGNLVVDGDLTIEGGTVRHIGNTGPYKPRRRYSILRSSHAIVGKFDGIESNYAFLDASLAYDTNTVSLVLQRNDIDFSDIGITRNERATGAAIQNGDWESPLFEAVIELDEDDARSAFGQMAGEIYASARSSTLSDSALIRRAVLNGRVEALEAGKTQIWASPLTSSAEYDGTSENGALESQTTGALIGAEHAFGANWQVGVIAGYDTTDIKGGALGSISRDTYHLGAQAKAHFGAFDLNSAVVTSFHDFDARRGIAFTGFSEQLKSQYSGTTTQAFAEAGWNTAVGGTAIRPFASLAYVSSETDALAETGGHAALDIASAEQAVTLATIGLDARHTFALTQARDLSVSGRVGWEKASGDVDTLQRQAFIDGDDFMVGGLGYDDSTFIAGIGAQTQLGRAGTVSVDWYSAVGDQRSQHTVSATYRLTF